MTASADLARLRDDWRAELRAVADWWLGHVVRLESGDIAGEVSNDNRRNPDAGWSVVYIARLLWFFSAVHRFEARANYRAAAGLCRDFLERHFTDRENGGLYWMLGADLQPVSRKKQSYGLAFAVYGLSEFARAFGDDAALHTASRLVDSLEHNARDPDHGGYLEALDERWRPLEDVRLGANDTNVDKTMNTHLHMLEAYTTFYRARPDAASGEALAELAELFLDRFPALGGHLLQYFGRDWALFPAGTSFGHDIESGWLLCEAADALGDTVLQERARSAAVTLSDAVLANGLDGDGAVMRERAPDGTCDPSRVWWVQAEAMVGFFNAWRISGEKRFLDACLGVWAFVQEHQSDRVHGEWLWFSAGDANAGTAYKAGAWKGPYHNGRALMELIARSS